MRQRPLPQGSAQSPGRHPQPSQQPHSHRTPPLTQRRRRGPNYSVAEEEGGHHHHHPSRSLSPPPAASGSSSSSSWEISHNVLVLAADAAERDHDGPNTSSSFLPPPPRSGLRPLHDDSQPTSATIATAASSASKDVSSAFLVSGSRKTTTTTTSSSSYRRSTLLSLSTVASSDGNNNNCYYSDPDLAVGSAAAAAAAADHYADDGSSYYPRRYYQNGEVHFRKTGNRRRTRPEDFHTVYRTPHHVPDRKFKDYLLGRAAAATTTMMAPSSASEGGRGRSTKRRSKKEGAASQRIRQPILTEESALRACLGFSVVGAAFLVWVGILLDKQPLYIKGSLPTLVVAGSNGRMVTRSVLPDPGGARLLPARVSYRAAILYAMAAAACWYRLNRGWVHSRIKRRRNRYEDIPDHFSKRGVGADDESNEGGSGSTALPLFDFRHHEGAASSTTAYQIGLGSRIKASVLQWLAVRGWFYRPAHKFRRKREPKCV